MRTVMPRKSIRRALTAVALLPAILLGSITPAPVAAADTVCSYPWCSEIYNQSPYQLTVAHDWKGTDDTLYQNAPPNGWGSVTSELWPGQHTPAHEDWDALRIDSGWKYVVQTYSVVFGWSSVGSFDNRNSSTEMWVHVHGDETMYVLAQYYG